jgi:hypothetical protein
MNDDNDNTTGARRRTSARLLAGVAGGAVLALVATTAPVAAKDLVTTADLAKGAVTSAKIAKKTVKTRNLANGAVKTAKLQDGAVTSAKLAAGAVGRDHLAADLQPLWAVVWGGPTIVRGKGAVSVAFEGINSQYRVTFDRDVSKCSYTATPSSPLSTDLEQVNMLSVATFAGDPKAVLVRSRDHDGLPNSSGFTVQVMC